jgi:hypothetical protein
LTSRINQAQVWIGGILKGWVSQEVLSDCLKGALAGAKPQPSS